MTRRKRTQDGGFVAIEFVAGIGFLLIPVALLMLAIPTWMERESLSRTAAREAARAYVLSGSHSAGHARAAQSVAQISVNAGLKPGDLQLVAIKGNTPGTRDGRATAVVRVKVPSIVLPFKEKVNTGNFGMTSQHTEVMDLYRSAP